MDDSEKVRSKCMVGIFEGDLGLLVDDVPIQKKKLKSWLGDLRSSHESADQPKIDLMCGEKKEVVDTLERR